MSNPLNVNVNDLTVMKSIIDCTTQRGAIKPNELKVVGELYENYSEWFREENLMYLRDVQDHSHQARICKS